MKRQDGCLFVRKEKSMREAEVVAGRRLAVLILGAGAECMAAPRNLAVLTHDT